METMDTMVVTMVVTMVTTMVDIETIIVNLRKYKSISIKLNPVVCCILYTVYKCIVYYGAKCHAILWW